MDDVYRPGIRLLSARQVELIVDEAYRVLEQVGVRVEHDEAIEQLSSAGAKVSDDRRRVFITQGLCEQCLATVPDTFSLYNRTGEEAFTMGGDDVHFAPGSAATHITDYAASTVRPPTTSDLVDFVVTTDRLAALDLQSTGALSPMTSRIR